MRNGNTFLACVVMLFMGKASELRAQGSLTPPSGTPAPTMRTLTQVEPRTPISTPTYIITEPGSYYLTTNLTTASTGVVIRASGVTLDLMGYSLSGANNAVGVVLIGETNGLLSNIVVRNGTIRNFSRGMNFINTQNARAEKLNIFANIYSGVSLGKMANGDGSVCRLNCLSGCIISETWGFGVDLCGRNGGRCDGNLIVDCVIGRNGLDSSVGMGGGVFFDGYGGSCDGNRLMNCLLNNNTGTGIVLSYADSNYIENNHVVGAGNKGISTSSGANNLVVQNVCVGQTNNFSLSSSDTYGPIVTASGALSTTNGAAGLSPWANFSR